MKTSCWRQPVTRRAGCMCMPQDDGSAGRLWADRAAAGRVHDGGRHGLWRQLAGVHRHPDVLLAHPEGAEPPSALRLDPMNAERNMKTELPGGAL